MTHGKTTMEWFKSNCCAAGQRKSTTSLLHRFDAVHLEYAVGEIYYRFSTDRIPVKNMNMSGVWEMPAPSPHGRRNGTR